MLVLTVKIGRMIRIGRGTTVTVLEGTHPGEIKLGIDAPQTVAVSRDDFTAEQHLRFQEDREAGRRSTT